LEETLYCIGTLQLLMKLPRITQNNVGRCLKSLVNIKNSSIVKANLEWLAKQGFIAQASTGGVDLGYRLTMKGIAHFAILDCLATHVLVFTLIKFLISKARETAEVASGEIKIDLRRAWVENYEFRKKTLHTLKRSYYDAISIMPIIIKIMDSSVRFEIMRSGGAGRQQGLQNHLRTFDVVEDVLVGDLVPINFQTGDLILVYKDAMKLCSLTLGVKNVGVETLRNYVDEIVHNNMAATTA